jgi:hypothetical protein
MSKQQAKARRSASDDDVLAIFRRLEATPMRARKTDAFLDEDFRLHKLLGLHSERRCSVCSVLDRRTAPPWPAEFLAHVDWLKVHSVRVELLAALKETASAPTVSI